MVGGGIISWGFILIKMCGVETNHILFRRMYKLKIYWGFRLCIFVYVKSSRRRSRSTGLYVFFMFFLHKQII